MYKRQLRHFDIGAYPAIVYLQCLKTCDIHPVSYTHLDVYKRQKDYKLMETSEMKYLRSVKGCIRLDHIKNEDIRQKLKVQPVTAEA